MEMASVTEAPGGRSMSCVIPRVSVSTVPTHEPCGSTAEKACGGAAAAAPADAASTRSAAAAVMGKAERAAALFASFVTSASASAAPAGQGSGAPVPAPPSKQAACVGTRCTLSFVASVTFRAASGAEPLLRSVRIATCVVAEAHSVASSEAPPPPPSTTVAAARARSSEAVQAPVSCGDETSRRSSVRPTVMVQFAPGHIGKPEPARPPSRPPSGGMVEFDPSDALQKPCTVP